MDVHLEREKEIFSCVSTDSTDKENCMQCLHVHFVHISTVLPT